MKSTSSILAFAGAVALVAALGGCSSNSDNPVVTQPTPTPTPAPTPEPTPTPEAKGCSLSDNPECGGPEGPSGVFGCCREENTDLLGFEVEAALTKVENERPELFRGEEGRVSDIAGLTQAVCEEIEANFAMCCKPGRPEDEIGVKKGNDFSEQWDLVFGTGFVRHNGYTVTCRPARF